MSSNFFAALDDSGDEAPAKAGKSAVVKKDTNNNASVSKPVEASKVDQRRRPNQNDRNTKHGRGGRAPPRDGKRQYDRRSGTGRGKEIKKGGGGARNWGSDKNEAKNMEGKINEEDVETKEEEAKVEDAPVAEEPVEPEPEPEADNTMTFAEYMASKEKKEEKTGRELQDEFEGICAASKKDEEDFLVMGGGKQKKTKKKKEEKKTVDVGFRVANPNAGFGESREDRGGRGGRGRGGHDGRGRGGRDGRGRGGRDGRGRGGREGRGRGGRVPKGAGFNMPQGLNVQDENAFPSL